MMLSCIWRLGFHLDSMEYIFIAITPRSPLTWSGRNCFGPINASKRSVLKLFFHVQRKKPLKKLLYNCCNCNHTLKECAGSPRQWCSWGPYVFWVFQHHSCSFKWLYRNYYSDRRSSHKKFANYAITLSTHLKKSKYCCYKKYKYERSMNAIP